MSSAGTNPIMSQIMGAAGDLGLSAGAKNEAADIAEKLKKKKEADLAAGGAGVMQSVSPAATAGGAATSLFGGV